MTVESMDLDATEAWFQTARNIRTGIDSELGRVIGLETSARNAAEAGRQPSNSGTTQLNAVMGTFVATETFAYDVYNTLAVTDFTEADAARLAELRALPQHVRILQGTYAELLTLEMKLEDAKAGDRGIQPPRRHPDGFTGGDPEFHELPAMQTAIQALIDTADSELIWQDEFEFVAFTHPDTGEPTGKYMLVLPGVTDLSSFKDDPGESLGWASGSYTARDTWIAARESHGSALIDDNVYARLVEDFIERSIENGDIPRGANLAIVGHSYGADTALDLASDPVFNGELVTITHVVAAAYHSEPQLPFVQDHTEVAVIQNIYDIPVLGEAILAGDGEPLARLNAEGGERIHNALVDPWNTGADVVNGTTDAVDFLADGVDAGAEALVDAPIAVAEGAANVGIGVVNTPSNIWNAFVPWGEAPTVGPVDLPDIDITDIPSIPNIEHIEEVDIGKTVIGVGDNITVVEFEGGFEGAGHHQNEYVTYLAEDGSNDLGAFFADMAESGFVGTGTAVSVDVTVPEEVRNPATPVVPVTAATPAPSAFTFPGPAPLPGVGPIGTPDVELEPVAPPSIAETPPPAPSRTPEPITDGGN